MEVLKEFKDKREIEGTWGNREVGEVAVVCVIFFFVEFSIFAGFLSFSLLCPAPRVFSIYIFFAHCPDKLETASSTSVDKLANFVKI